MIPGTDMWIGTGVYIDNIAGNWATVAAELEKDADHALWLALGFVTGGFVLVLLPISIILVRSIIKPLRGMIAMLKDIAEGEGDLTRRLTDTSGAERQVGGWFNLFVSRVHRVIKDVAQNSGQVVDTNHLRALSSELGQASDLMTGKAETWPPRPRR